MPRLVLASTSRYRRELLDRLGVPYLAVAPPYVEEHGLALPPPELVVTLATRKAESLARSYPDALILGADQLAVLGDQLLHKPGTPERAVAQLAALRGREHTLLTGVALLEAASGRLETALDQHTLRLRALSDEQLRRYVELDQPLDCAGAYKVEGRGIALFESLAGRDFTGIIGLPLTRVVELLARFGWLLP